MIVISILIATIVTPLRLRLMRTRCLQPPRNEIFSLNMINIQRERIVNHVAKKRKPRTTKNKSKDFVSQSLNMSQQEGLTSNKFHYCYFLRSKNLTYNGYTVDLKRRLRQHNREISGGAKYTGRKNVVCPWSYMAIFHSPQWNKTRAMQVEWICKYPTRRKPRPKIFSGPKGRMDSLASILNFIPESEKKHITLYLHIDFMFIVDKYKLNQQVSVRPLEEIIGGNISEPIIVGLDRTSK
mmetsp:Transcript_17257/g.25003  ORF Transcript_17257/g.25003 Transcript_17257/m.25003 type:complete len:239 (-) Transcript_17257:475-1191(-)